MDKKNIFFILLVLGTAFWGISFPVTKIAIGNASLSTFLFYRFLLATIVLGLLFSKQVRQLNIRTIKAGVLLALPLAFGINLQTLGVKYTLAAQCAFIAGTCVILIPIIKLIFYRTTVDLKIWIAAIIALIGLFIISINKNFSVNIGDFYTLAGSFGFAFYLINIETYSKKNDILPTIVPMFATCTFIALLLAVFDSSADWMPGNQVFWAGILYCALFSTAYMYTVSNLSQRYISAEKVSIIYLFEPVFASIAAFFILHEGISARLLIGGCLIFFGTLISELDFKKMLKIT